MTTIACLDTIAMAVFDLKTVVCWTCSKGIMAIVVCGDLKERLSQPRLGAFAEAAMLSTKSTYYSLGTTSYLSL